MRPVRPDQRLIVGSLWLDLANGALVFLFAPDTVGVFALWQPAKAEAAEYRGTAGTWCWNELYTDQPEASVTLMRETYSDGRRMRSMTIGSFSAGTSAGKSNR